MTDQCKIIGKAIVFCETPAGKERLERFLDQQDQLLTTEDVSKLTTWCTEHILRLCRQKRLPHIPGRPHTFVYTDLMATLRKMQVGGDFGRRRSTKLEGLK